MAYIGPAVTVADVVVRPSRSIIKQSYDARERRNDSSLPFHLVRRGSRAGAGGRQQGQGGEADRARMLLADAAYR